MDNAELAIFNAYAILAAHVNRLQAIVQQGAEGHLQAQIDIVKKAADELAKLPRPQQKAA